MGFAEGRVSAAPFSAEEQPLVGERICDEFIGQLARLQALNYQQMGLEWLGEPADLAEPAVEQTRHWREIYDRDRMEEHYPVLSAAFAWLAANPVRADRITVVHGDFRAGNFLYDERGLLALLDWEMAHLGDPMEDLGWASMMFWGREDLAGGMLEREAFYRLYERKTGFKVDRERLFFYQVLGNAKMAVICLTGIRAFVEGKTSDTVMPFLEFLLSPLFDDLANQLKLT
jgi:aminoglycoside phosphotransferase (APT) family kinase protein